MKKRYYLLLALLLNLTNTSILQTTEQKQTTPYKFITTTTLYLATTLAKDLSSQGTQPAYPITTLQAIQQNGQTHARLLQKIDPHNTYQTQLPLHFHTNWTLEKLQNIPLQHQHHYIHLITNTHHQPQACYIGPAGLQGGGNGQSTGSYESYDDFEFGYDYSRDNSNNAKNTHENTPPATHDDSDHKTYSTPSTPRNNFPSLSLTNLHNDTDDYLSNAISNFTSNHPIESYIQENLTFNTTTHNSPSSSRHHSPSPPSYHYSPKINYQKNISPKKSHQSTTSSKSSASRKATTSSESSAFDNDSYQLASLSNETDDYMKQTIDDLIKNDPINQIKETLSNYHKSPELNFSLPKTDFETYARNNSSPSPKTTTRFSFSPPKEKSPSPKLTNTLHTPILDTIKTSDDDLYPSTIASKNTTKPLQKILQNQPPFPLLLQNPSLHPTKDTLPKIHTPHLGDLLKPSNPQPNDLLSLLNTSKEQNTQTHNKTPKPTPSAPTQTNSLLDLLNEPQEENPLQPYLPQPNLPDKLSHLSLHSTDGKPFDINLNDPNSITQQTDAFAKQYFAQRTHQQPNPPKPKEQEDKQTDSPPQLSINYTTNPYLNHTHEQLIQTADKLLESDLQNPEEHKEERNKLLGALKEKRDNLKQEIISLQEGLDIACSDEDLDRLGQAEQQEKELYEQIKALRAVDGRENTPGAAKRLGTMAVGFGKSGVDGVKGLANVVIHPIETAENLGKAISKIPDALDYIASEIQEELNNPEEHQKKQAIKRRQALDAYYAQDTYSLTLKECEQAGYLAGELVQLFYGPAEIIKGATQLAKMGSKSNKILNTLDKAGIAEEKIAEFSRTTKIADQTKRTQALNTLLYKEKKIEKTLQQAGYLPKVSNKANKLSNVSKTKQLNKPPLDKTSRLAKNKARGLAAEKRCDIKGPKKSIQVKNKTRVPDSLSNKKIIEIKNVKEQGLTPQLKDYIKYGKEHNNPPILRVRPNTKIQKPLLEEAKKGNIIIKKDIPLTP